MAEHRVSENSNVVIFVGRENTNRRKRVTLGIGADIIDLTDEIQNLFTLGADEDITLYLENEASGGIGKKVPAVGGLKEYAGQTMVFKVNELENTFPVYVGQIGSGPPVKIECKKEANISSLIQQIRNEKTEGLKDFHVQRDVAVYE
ncbi:uncharacterized protein [Ptychodera flava]|uniref:uncharacterized protein n=1 Tax=Ptychodera flava TaxID=63121 RepID=UPI00396A8CAB